MVFRTLVLAIVVFVAFVGAGFAAYQVASQSQDAAAVTNTTVENESLVQQVGIWQLTDKAESEFTQSFSNHTTVYNNSSAELVRGTDYEWNATDGTIKFLSSPNTTDGENATITYEVTENTEAVQNTDGVIDSILTITGNPGIIAAGFGFVVLLLAFAGILGKFFWSGNEYGGGR